MRFRRTPRYPEFEDTRRKRLALARKQRLEREKFPLLAELIAERQPDADTVMADRAERWILWEAERRKQIADLWRKARRRLSAYGANTRAALIHAWNIAPYPPTPGYLLDFLHSYEVGRIDLENLPWIYRGNGLKAVDIGAIVAAAQARREGVAP